MPRRAMTNGSVVVRNMCALMDQGEIVMNHDSYPSDMKKEESLPLLPPCKIISLHFSIHLSRYSSELIFFSKQWQQKTHSGDIWCCNKENGFAHNDTPCLTVYDEQIRVLLLVFVLDLTFKSLRSPK